MGPRKIEADWAWNTTLGIRDVLVAVVDTFNWNTSGVELYTNYTLRAEATTLPGEIDPNNNIYINGAVVIKLLGDVNGDRTIDIFDVVLASVALGAQPGEPLWNPIADLNQDAIIDIFDLVIVVIRLGQTIP